MAAKMFPSKRRALLVRLKEKVVTLVTGVKEYEAITENGPGISTLEQDIRLDELFETQEAFLTNSLVEVMPLTEIDGKPVGSGSPGAITKRLMAEYRKLVVAPRTSEQ